MFGSHLNLRLWIFVVIVIWAIIQGLFSSHYLFFDPDHYAFVQQRLVYVANASSILLHIGLGVVALMIGPVQFFQGLRKRHPKLHRVCGYVYFVAVLLGGVSALIFAPEAFGGVSNTAAFSFLALLWIGSTIAAVISARRGQFPAHRQWMMRSYALTFAAATLRLQLGLLIALGLSFEQAYLIVPWSSWIINLIIVEWWLLSQKAALLR